VGNRTASELEKKSKALYLYAREYARERGIIIADTKFEFGFNDKEIILIDEALTPDSSRFWDAELYKPGRPQPNYDKQYVRDWLIASGWNQKPPAPELPEDVVEATAERYREAYFLLTGRKLKNVFS
jgi:phosphoribosylaminoimidazole-succinocarboxamide synthase